MKAISLIRFGFRLFGPLFPAACGAVACRLWFTTLKSPLKPRDKDFLAAAQLPDYTFNGKNVRLYCWPHDRVDAPTVLLLHGWNSRAAHFSTLIPKLHEAGYQVIAFDAPGHGQSEGHRTDMEEISKIAGHLHEQYGPFHAVVTHSFGAASALYASRNNMIQAARFVLISPPATISGLVEKFQQQLRIPGNVTERMRRRIEKHFAHLRNGSQKSIWQILNPVENITQLPQPLLIIHDELDTDIPIAEGELLAAANPHAKFIRTKGVAHRAMLRNKEVMTNLLAFLNEAAAQPQTTKPDRREPEQSSQKTAKSS